MSKLEANEWPNSPGMYELHVHNKRIGLAQKLETGWLVFGRKKPVGTLEEAAKQCLDKAMSQHRNEIEKLRAMLATVLGHNAKVKGCGDENNETEQGDSAVLSTAGLAVNVTTEK